MNLYVLLGPPELLSFGGGGYGLSHDEAQNKRPLHGPDLAGNLKRAVIIWNAPETSESFHGAVQRKISGSPRWPRHIYF